MIYKAVKVIVENSKIINISDFYGSKQCFLRNLTQNIYKMNNIQMNRDDNLYNLLRM